ncbi:CocE/NonD family hydrolase [Novosphingobium pentaromativorans]|uniref:Xaa-Pro dipeptidyl-peptidase C-terminal domain-containing protein n=1 Tax=Novosphingobium pentaromativorans US6-1 TaxID=1088721 RepID=G6EFN1_9SPHN|nr:CocE/NonD family hydrolase [Novosphingobium pentaromativorans]EHJ59902.1 hypothetical protein NSU_3152 [Novosphingobium pentaromativorans US6-1]
MVTQINTLITPYRQAKPASHPPARYPGFNPAIKRLSTGSVVRDGALPLACDLVMEQDVAVRLRDGTTIYVDIFRPADAAGPLPALVSWGPYGKQGGVITFDDLPHRGGVPVESVSGLEMFEGPDPAFWCANGYAVVNADARGAFSSEGDIRAWGRQEGRDGHDLVEWIAAQPWSNGKVGLTGTSWLAIVQWFIAAERPPHLAAIAPCEGWTDLYRCDVVRGGVPDAGFADHMFSMFAGGGRVEDVPAMARANPLMGTCWEDKIPALGNIEVPAFVLASWTNLIHAMGTLNGWRGIASPDKWLRIHNTHEWTEYYTSAPDLLRFFDHYLKGEDNGWEATPRVRMAILDPGGADIVDRPEKDFPLARTDYRPLYLDAASATLGDIPASASATVRYDPCDEASRAIFEHRFDRDTEIAGYIKLHLWVEAVDADDLDIYCEVRKLGAGGKHLASRTFLPPGVDRQDLPENPEELPGMIVFAGAKGIQRVSLRATDPARSGPAEPFHMFDRVEKLAPGEVVPVDIQIWPLGMRWRAGERLQLVIGGKKLSGVEFPGLAPADTINLGTHVIHTGGSHDSHLLLPVTN